MKLKQYNEIYSISKVKDDSIYYNNKYYAKFKNLTLCTLDDLDAITNNITDTINLDESVNDSITNNKKICLFIQTSSMKSSIDVVLNNKINNIDYSAINDNDTLQNALSMSLLDNLLQFFKTNNSNDKNFLYKLYLYNITCYDSSDIVNDYINESNIIKNTKIMNFSDNEKHILYLNNNVFNKIQDLLSFINKTSKQFSKLGTNIIKIIINNDKLLSHSIDVILLSTDKYDLNNIVENYSNNCFLYSDRELIDTALKRNSLSNFKLSISNMFYSYLNGTLKSYILTESKKDYNRLLETINNSHNFIEDTMESNENIDFKNIKNQDVGIDTWNNTSIKNISNTKNNISTNFNCNSKDYLNAISDIKSLSKDNVTIDNIAKISTISSSINTINKYNLNEEDNSNFSNINTTFKNSNQNNIEKNNIKSHNKNKNIQVFNKKKLEKKSFTFNKINKQNKLNKNSSCIISSNNYKENLINNSQYKALNLDNINNSNNYNIIELNNYENKIRNLANSYNYLKGNHSLLKEKVTESNRTVNVINKKKNEEIEFYKSLLLKKTNENRKLSNLLKESQKEIYDLKSRIFNINNNKTLNSNVYSKSLRSLNSNNSNNYNYNYKNREFNRSSSVKNYSNLSNCLNNISIISYKNKFSKIEYKDNNINCKNDNLININNLTSLLNNATQSIIKKSLKLNSINKISFNYFKNSRDYILNNTINYDNSDIKLRKIEEDINNLTTNIINNNKKINDDNIVKITKLNNNSKKLNFEKNKYYNIIEEKQRELNDKEHTFNEDISKIKEEMFELINNICSLVKHIDIELQLFDLDYKKEDI